LGREVRRESQRKRVKGRERNTNGGERERGSGGLSVERGREVWRK